MTDWSNDRVTRLNSVYPQVWSLQHGRRNGLTKRGRGGVQRSGTHKQQILTKLGLLSPFWSPYRFTIPSPYHVSSHRLTTLPHHLSPSQATTLLPYHLSTLSRYHLIKLSPDHLRTLRHYELPSIAPYQLVAVLFRCQLILFTLSLHKATKKVRGFPLCKLRWLSLLPWSWNVCVFYIFVCGGRAMRW